MVVQADFGLKIGADSLLAFVKTKNGKIQVVKNLSGEESTKYYISFAHENKVIIGPRAQEDMETHPESVIYDFFELLGLNDSEIAVDQNWKFHVYASDLSDGIEIGYKDASGTLCRMSAFDMMTLFLYAVKQSVENFTGVKAKTVKTHVQLGITREQRDTVHASLKKIGLTVL